MNMRVSINTVLALALVLIVPFQTRATTSPPLSEECRKLFNLPAGTMTQEIDKKVVANPEACAAYSYLISIYRPGKDSARCIPNVQVNGITGLNPDFAIRAAKMLKEASNPSLGGVGQFYINSAYRNQCAQGSANPNATAKGFVSMHSKGLALDLIYPGGGTNHDCSSAGYKWIISNARRFGIAQYDQIHKPVSGECNHVENTGQVAGGAGPGSSAAGGSLPSTSQTSPTSAFGNMLRQALGLPQQQMPQPTTPYQNVPQALSPLSAFQQPIISNNEPRIDTTPFPAIPSGTSGPSVADRLDAFLKQVGVDATITPVTIRGNTTTVIVINPNDIGYSSTTTLEAASNTPGYAYVPVHVPTPQTFTSPDIAAAQEENASTMTTLSTLERIKLILETLFKLLRPFNRTQAVPEEYHYE